MQRAAKVLSQMGVGRGLVTSEEWVRNAWPAAVGRQIARHTANPRLVRTTLVVDVPDTTWRRQLYGLREPVLRKLQDLLGAERVTAIEFRVGVVPSVADAPPQPGTQAPLTADEADQIADPVLQRIYRAARKRATE